MNRIEYNEVLKAVGINNPLAMTKTEYCRQEYVHCWGELAIWYNGGDAAIVRGKIPQEVVDIIKNRYSRYQINADGEIKDGYLEGYRIKTRDGLLAFILEMKDYYLRKNNLQETEVGRLFDLRGEVTKGLIEKINPTISAYDWMQGDIYLRKDYNAVIERDNKSVIGKVFRDVINDFDKAVNPFLDKDVYFDDMANCLVRVKIYGTATDDYKGRYRKGSGCLKIVEDGTSNSAFYERSPLGFKFQLVYGEKYPEQFTILHYYTTDGETKFDRGEFIEIHDACNKQNDIRFNISNGLVGYNECLKTPVTLEQFDSVCNILKKASQYAYSVTVKNMQVYGNNK